MRFACRTMMVYGNPPRRPVRCIGGGGEKETGGVSVSDNDKQRYRNLLQKACLDETANDAPARERIYARMHDLNEAMLEKRVSTLDPAKAAALRQALRDVVGEDKSAFWIAQASVLPVAEAANAKPRETVAPPPVQPMPPVRPAMAARLVTLATGIVAGMAVVLAGTWAIDPAETSPTTAPGTPAFSQSWQKAYQAGVPKVEIASAFLERVSDAVIDRQNEDGVGLTAVAGGDFVPLKDVAPELAAEFPKELKGSKIIVRADEVGYKILLDWPLCATAQIVKPDMVDPKRRRKATVGCSHFGVWNKSGAEW